jgi:hypothetical protein
MSTEALARAEQIQTSPEEIDALLHEARDAFYDLPFDEDFNALCVERGLDPEDTSRPAYWEAAADFAAQSSAKAREAGEDERGIALRELFAATPDFIYKRKIASGDFRNYPPEVYRSAKESVSYYNGLIRYVAEECHDMRASVLTKGLVGIANISVEHEGLKQSSPDAIRDVVRGAQHEMVFGQLLEHTDRDFRTATVEEDLEGTDYVVLSPDGTEQRIDVKASQGTIVHRGGTSRPYVNGEYGNIIFFSLVEDRELHDRFYVTDKLAEQKAQVLQYHLDNLASGGSEVVWAG